jgi:hypothetical protein|tara:strand:- start:126 stop:410 length:285 start_codon:yes stop_codon:yes gene_type:complete
MSTPMSERADKQRKIDNLIRDQEYLDKLSLMCDNKNNVDVLRKQQIQAITEERDKDVLLRIARNLILIILLYQVWCKFGPSVVFYCYYLYIINL